MIGVLVFTHGRLCAVLTEEVERLTGVRPYVACLSMQAEETIEQLIDRLVQTIDAIDQGNGVLVLVDVVGGTPWNVVGRLQKKGSPIRRIGGAGMPGFIKALSDRGEHTDLDAWVDELVQYSRSHVSAD